MNTERAAWRMQFRLAYAEKHGDEFEAFVRSLLELSFPGDFIPVAAAGSVGDRKCDGLLPSQRRFFQAHAPKNFNKRDLLDKIGDDYTGAIEHWGDRFDTWTFVHNSREGLPPYATDLLHELSESDDSHHVGEQWRYVDLLNLAMDLSDDDLTEFLGPPLRAADFLEVEIADIVELLESIQDIDPAEAVPINPVPFDKLEHNRFSPSYESQLRQGMRRTDRVQRYFEEQVARPMYRDDMAARFAFKYESLKEEAYVSDEIVDELLAWIIPPPSNLKIQAAALSVIAYFFEQCDIFESSSEQET